MRFLLGNSGGFSRSKSGIPTPGWTLWDSDWVIVAVSRVPNREFPSGIVVWTTMGIVQHYLKPQFAKPGVKGGHYSRRCSPCKPTLSSPGLYMLAYLAYSVIALHDIFGLWQITGALYQSVHTVHTGFRVSARGGWGIIRATLVWPNALETITRTCSANYYGGIEWPPYTHAQRRLPFWF